MVFNNIPFKIEEKKVLRELRIPRSIETLKDINEEHIARDIKNAIDLAYSLIKGAACYRTFKIEMIRREIPTTEIPKQVRDDRDAGFSDETSMSRGFTKDDENNPPIPPLEKGGKGGFERLFSSEAVGWAPPTAMAE